MGEQELQYAQEQAAGSPALIIIHEINVSLLRIIKVQSLLCVCYVPDSFTDVFVSEGCIDLKCKERVTDSDEENDPAEETDGKVHRTNAVKYVYLSSGTNEKIPKQPRVMKREF